MRFFALIVCLLTSSTRVNAHGTLTKVQVKRTQQTACSVHSNDPECNPSHLGLSIRSVISRAAGQVCSKASSGTCSKETADCCAIPGDPTKYNCDHCGLERVTYTASALTNQKWWTDLPAIYWDLPAVAPTKTCMSNDGFGDRGTISVKSGDTLSTAWYVNADHSGLYRFELSCGKDARETDFMANPLSPWKALHRSKELGQSDALPESRIVGSTRAATDAYYRDRTVCTGTGCDTGGAGAALWSGKRHMNPDTQGIDSSYCRNNRDSCFIEDEIVIPANTQCRGSATLRWKWNSAEGKEIYAACVDLNIEDGSGGTGDVNPTPKPGGTGDVNPTPKPGGTGDVNPTPKPQCTKADLDIWTTGVEISCCEGLNQCLEDRPQDSPLFDKFPQVLICRSQACGGASGPSPNDPTTTAPSVVSSGPSTTTAPSVASSGPSPNAPTTTAPAVVSSCDKTRVNSQTFALIVCSTLLLFLK